MIPYTQLSVEDNFAGYQNKFEDDKPAFLALLESYIELDEIVSVTFRNHFYASTGRNRKYPLYDGVLRLMPPKSDEFCNYLYKLE